MLIKQVVLLLTGILVLMPSFTLDAENPGIDSLRSRIMFYNTENFFDIIDDPETNDDEFLPSGRMRWNYTRYKNKLNSVAKTIIAAGEWEPPVVVAMCEIENRKILEDLVTGNVLLQYDYGIIHEDSPDTRGIDVCFIFRKDFVKVISYKYLIPDGIEGDFHSRSVLYSKILICGDTLHLLVNHWPSRRGGVLAGENLRTGIASMVAALTDSLHKRSRPVAKIIVTGDFNCTPDDDVIQHLVSNQNSTGSLLVNMTATGLESVKGTYRYQGKWELIDQFIVSDELLNASSGLYVEKDSFSIFESGFLLRYDPKYPGMTPFSTYRGFRYQGGVSDHLPVLLELLFR